MGIKEKEEFEVRVQTKIISNIPYSVSYKEDKTLEEGVEVTEQKGANGCKSETYRILKDATGKVVSQTLLSKDTYNALERIVRKGTKKVKKTDSTDEVVTTKPTGGVTSEIDMKGRQILPDLRMDH